nr:protein EIN4 [Ipomoea batatas]
MLQTGFLQNGIQERRRVLNLFLRSVRTLDPARKEARIRAAREREGTVFEKQKEASMHVRMLTLEIRKSLDKHTILYTTLVELSKTLNLQNCAVWMPSGNKAEMNLTHELNPCSGREHHSLSINDLDVLEITKNEGVRMDLVYFLHLAALSLSIVLQCWHFNICITSILIDAQPKLQHPVNPVPKSIGIIKAKTRCEKSSLEQQQNKILHRFVVLVSISSFTQLLHDGVLRVDLHGLLARHVPCHARVPESLSLHNSLHVSSPSIFSRNQTAGRVHNTVRNNHLLNPVTKYIFHHLAQTLELGLQFLLFLLIILTLIKLQTFLGRRYKLLSIKLLQLPNSILINGINHVKDLVPLLLQLFQEGRVLHRLLTLTSNVEDIILPFLHPCHIILQARHFITTLGGMVSQQFSNLSSVLGIFMDTKLQILGESLIKLVVIILILCNLKEELNALLNQVLANDLKDLVLLQHLSISPEVSLVTVNEPPAWDSHTYCSSSLCFVVTMTFSATKDNVDEELRLSI